MLDVSTKNNIHCIFKANCHINQTSLCCYERSVWLVPGQTGCEVVVVLADDQLLPSHWINCHLKDNMLTLLTLTLHLSTPDVRAAS